jgi:hypothetical protein
MMRWLQVLRKRRRCLRPTRLVWREPSPGAKTEEIGSSSEMAGANRRSAEGRHRCGRIPAPLLMLKMMSVCSVTKTPWNRSNLNSRSGFSCCSLGTFRSLVKFNPHSMEEDEMKKLGYVIAALGAIAVAAPSIASAETVVVKHRDHGWHHNWHRDYGWHRDHGWRHHDKMVVVRHRHEG